MKQITRTTATLTWRDTRDNVGVAKYQVRAVVKGGRRTLRRAAGSSVNTTVTVKLRGAKPGAKLTYEVLARDGSGNVSRAARVTVRVPKDRKRPKAPRTVRSSGSGTTAVLTWSRSTDDVGVSAYRVSYRVGSSWKTLRTISGRRLIVRGLVAGTTYQFRVQAKDRSGKYSHASRIVRVRR